MNDLRETRLKPKRDERSKGKARRNFFLKIADILESLELKLEDIRVSVEGGEGEFNDEVVTHSGRKVFGKALEYRVLKLLKGQYC